MIAFRRTAFLPLALGILTPAALPAQPAPRPAAAQGAGSGIPATLPSPSTQRATTHATAARPGSAGLPEIAELHAAFERGEYASVINHADRALRFRGKAAEGYDRHAATVLKAESHLRLKQFKSAADAFGAAAKLASDDVTAAATARAMQRIVSETKGAPVRRRPPRAGEGPASADLLDPAQREDALRIFRDNLRAEAEPKVKAALRATTIPPITQALDLVWLKMDFEHATGGTVAEDLQTRRDLAERIRKLVEDEIAAMEQNVDAIWSSASSVVGQIDTVPRSKYVIAQYRGLSEADRDALRGVIDTCGGIIPTLRKLGRAVGADAQRDPRLMKRASELRRVAGGVLRQTYEDQLVPAAARRRR